MANRKLWNVLDLWKAERELNGTAHGQCQVNRMIPDKKIRDKWRQEAANEFVMASAIGEYTPPEFVVLLDAVDELEAQRDALLMACEKAIEFMMASDPFCNVSLKEGCEQLREAIAEAKEAHDA